MIARRLSTAAKQLSLSSTPLSSRQAAHCRFALRLLSTEKKAASNDNATRASWPNQKSPRIASKELDRIHSEKPIDYDKRSSFRARQAQHAADEEEKKKKKKRGPPGPIQFESLTAHTSVHSNLPFSFRYSYTEIPKVPPVGFQEKFSPFGPGRLDRAWDGQQAVPSSSSPPPPPPPSVSSSSKYPDTHVENIKNSKYSFKGIKMVNPPSPNLTRTHTKRPRNREDILGEPLTMDEIKEFVENASKSKTRRQINMGRDGLTHNMLIEAHDHWKREPIVRVKCKGVPTLDMENVCFQLEDKTGGKIIHRKGGTIYLFRGRNYNYKDRPIIPPMLWKPHAPLYPKLITEAPGGLKIHEANFLRKRGLRIMRLCILSKNGYYGDLVGHVKDAFEDDELVRIDCKGLNTSDYKKIGAKLRDLVPCYLLSFEKEQIILWKGKDNDSSITDPSKSPRLEETQGANRRTVENAVEDIALVNDRCEYASITRGGCNDVREDINRCQSVACIGDTSDEDAESASEDQWTDDTEDTPDISAQNGQNPIIEHPEDVEETGSRSQRTDSLRDITSFRAPSNRNQQQSNNGYQSNNTYQSYSFQSSSTSLGGSGGSFYSSSSMRRVGPDGIVQEEHNERDSSGKESRTSARGLRDQVHAVTKKRHVASGPESTVETLRNLMPEEAPHFDAQWEARAQRSLPGWNSGRAQALEGNYSMSHRQVPPALRYNDEGSQPRMPRSYNHGL